jgi:hypothetical protein
MSNIDQAPPSPASGAARELSGFWEMVKRSIVLEKTNKYFAVFTIRCRQKGAGPHFPATQATQATNCY